MRCSIVILLLLFCCKSDAQTYAQTHYEYDRIYKTIKGYYNRGLYHKAVLYPDSLTGNKYVDGSSYFFFARVYALSNEFDQALVNLEKAVKRGITKTQIIQMYDLDGFRGSNLHIIYEMNYDKWHQDYLDLVSSIAFDSVYIKQIQKISQLYSNNLRLRKVEGEEIIWVKDSTKYYYTRKRLDAAIFYAIVDLTIEKGFPTKRTIGKEYYRYSRYLRYNMPDTYDENCEDWQKVKTMIFAEMEKGTVYPFYYAAIEDKMRQRTNSPQLNGTISSRFYRLNNIVNTIEYEKPEELNLRRRAVGLCSIQLEMWSEARELPESLKEIEFK